MNRQDWEKSKDKLQKLLEKGVEELKELAAEASYMTDATTNVIKMEVDVHRLRTRLEKAQTRLGREVFRTAPLSGPIVQSPQIKKLIEEIRSVEKKIQKDEKDIQKIPLSWKAAKAAAKKMMGEERGISAPETISTPKTTEKPPPPRKKVTRAKKSSKAKKGSN